MSETSEQTIDVVISDYGFGKTVEINGAIFATVFYLEGTTSVLLYINGEARIGRIFTEESVATEFLTASIGAVVTGDPEQVIEFALAAEIFGAAGEPFGPSL